MKGVNKMERKFGTDKSYKAYDYKNHKYKEFNSWYSAVVFAQRNGIKNYTVVKVDNHYEIH